MSHFLRIKTQIREQEHLVTALRALHYECRVGENLEVRGYAGGKERAEVVVDTGSSYDIGFQKKTAEYEMVADWWGVEGNTQIKQQSFIQQLNRQYAYNLIHDQAQEQNLIVEEEQEMKNGDVVIILSERG